MKKSLVALAALAFVGAAFAQSSVKLTGTVDATLAYGSGDVANKSALSNSGLNSSEWRLTAVEDLGGGLKVGAVLAAGINNDNGSGGSTNTNNQSTGGTTGGGLVFNRKSLLRLMGGFGEIKAGRDYTPAFWTEAIYDPFGINGVGTSRAFQGGAAYTGSVAVRASNSIGYVSPNMGGFDVWAQVYTGEAASNVNATADGGQFQVNYGAGPLNLSAAYGKTNAGSGVDSEVSNAAAMYNFGAFTLQGYVQKNKLTGSHDIDGYLVGGSMPMGAGLIRASYSNTDNGTAKTGQFAIGYVYNLSKTTQLYGTFASVTNDGYASGTPGLNGGVPSLNGSSTGIDVGMSMAF